MSQFSQTRTQTDTRAIPTLLSELKESDDQFAKIIGHLSARIDQIDPDSEFDVRTRKLRLESASPEEFVCSLSAQGYDGLFFVKDGGVRSHILFQRKGETLHAYSIWVDGRAGNTQILRMLRTFVKHVREHTDASHIQLGMNGPGMARLAGTISKYERRYGIRAEQDGLFSFRAKPTIHPTAVVEADLKSLGPFCRIGPYAVVEKDVVLGPYVDVEAHAIVRRGVHIGSETKVHPYACIETGSIIGENNVIESYTKIGGTPQDRSAFGGGYAVRIGDNNHISEQVTIHRSTKPEHVTSIGDNNFIMAGVHVAHDAQIGNRVTLVNDSLIGGHALVDDEAYIAAKAAVAPKIHIGAGSLISVGTPVKKHLPPYCVAEQRGDGVWITSPNRLGMRAKHLERSVIQSLNSTYKQLFWNGVDPSAIPQEALAVFEVARLVEFVSAYERHTILPVLRKRD